MALDLNTALNSYGFVGQVANSIPDLKRILSEAIKAEYGPDQFKRAVEDSPWWKKNADAVRKLAILQKTDPATYTQNLGNAANKVQLISGSMGRTVKDPRAFALQALLHNWDEEQIRSQIGASGGFANDKATGAFEGSTAQLTAHMQQLYSNYGVAYTNTNLTGWATRIQSGQDTIDGFEATVKARAKAQYTHLAPQIDAGMTLRDIADPYIAQYAQTLEVPESGVKLTDPSIMKALQVKDPATGVFSTRPMYEFVRQLKDDPRWDKTKNAEKEAYSMVNRLGKDMGFLS